MPRRELSPSARQIPPKSLLNSQESTPNPVLLASHLHSQSLPTVGHESTAAAVLKFEETQGRGRLGCCCRPPPCRSCYGRRPPPCRSGYGCRRALPTGAATSPAPLSLPDLLRSSPLQVDPVQLPLIPPPYMQQHLQHLEVFKPGGVVILQQAPVKGMFALIFFDFALVVWNQERNFSCYCCSLEIFTT